MADTDLDLNALDRNFHLKGDGTTREIELATTTDVFYLRQAIYLGPGNYDQDGCIRMIISSGKLRFEKRVAGAYTGHSEYVEFF